MAEHVGDTAEVLLHTSRLHPKPAILPPVLVLHNRRLRRKCEPKPWQNPMPQVAHDPRILIPFSHEGDTDEMRVQDASAFVDEGEELSFWELMVRAALPSLQNAVSSKIDSLGKMSAAQPHCEPAFYRPMQSNVAINADLYLFLDSHTSFKTSEALVRPVGLCCRPLHNVLNTYLAPRRRRCGRRR